MKKRFIIFLLFLLLSSILLSSVSQAEDTNLLNNGGFEVLNADGSPKDWFQKAYQQQEGYSKLSVTRDIVHSGQYAVCIENAEMNDARFVSTVSVDPKSMYCLSCYVLVDSMQNIGNGANIALEDIYCVSAKLFSTEGDWKQLVWYGETGPNQRELTFSVRVGGYSNESVGKAYFDDVSLTKITKLPENQVADLWYAEYSTASNNNDTSSEAKTEPLKLILYVAAFLLLFLLLYYFLPKANDISPVAICFFFVVALVFRIWISLSVSGYSVDIRCFSAWSERMAAVGPASFYSDGYFCDYPPGMLILLWPIGLLLRNVEYATPLYTAILKLLPVLCDLAGAMTLYLFYRKNEKKSNCIFAALLYLFNPAVLLHGAAWGQVDSILAFMILLAFLFTQKGKVRWALPIYIAAVLIKPQALLAGPVALGWLIAEIWAKRHEKEKLTAIWKDVGIGALLSLLTATAIVMPFAIKQAQPFRWLISVYSSTFASYDYITLNTANFYYLLGCNWIPLTEKVPFLLPIGTCVVFLTGSVFLFIRKNNAVAALFAAMSAAQVVLLILSCSYREYGYCWMAFVYLWILIRLFIGNRKNELSFLIAFAYIGIYVFGIKIHERYLFPAILLLLASYLQTKDRRILFPIVGFSCTTFLNAGIVLENSIVLGEAYGHLNQDTLFLNCGISVLNIFLCGTMGWFMLSGLRESPPAAVKHTENSVSFSEARGYQTLLLKPLQAKLNLRSADWIIMLSVTVAYAVLTLSTLGSFAAPQTEWTSTGSEEEVILALEEESEFSILYYGGVSYHNFSIAVSSDGKSWSEEYPCEMREGLCYRWIYMKKAYTSGGTVYFQSDSPDSTLWVKGRYIRIRPEHSGLHLWEVVARNREGESLPLQVLSDVNAREDLLSEPRPASNLVDEMDTCVGEPGWYNGTYFDEIYYARTAYEHLHGQNPYETTHPPLGKLLMALCVGIFGMTPFGWRFAGAFTGVLMLPVLYLLAMQLTHKRKIAVAAIGAFALDLMHFTQTRLATIDSFAVFFILLSFLFMIRYYQHDTFAIRQKRSCCFGCRAEKGKEIFVQDNGWIWLLLCGISMGLSIASKWTGLYSAIGLAILFFAKQYRSWSASRFARGLCKEALSNGEKPSDRFFLAANETNNTIATTCALCVGFFILIPALIYYLCYIPYLSPTGPVTIQRVIEVQKSMLRYHSQPGLGMDHPFYSPWWQWPLILKPMWLAQDCYEKSGYASTIVCMGNPWVFYIGALCMTLVLLVLAAKLLLPQKTLQSLRLDMKDQYHALPVLCVAFLVQYLPWVLVPRGTYIYHYFASVPFIILACALCIDNLPRLSEREKWIPVGIFLLGALIFFIMFFPYASGTLTNTEWLNAMKWFKGLYY